MEVGSSEISYRLPPEEVIIALSGILKVSIATIRGAATPKYAESCWETAYHAHNVPSLLHHYNRQNLKYYLRSARRYKHEYQELFHHPPAELLPYWEQLEAYLEKTKDEEV